MERSSEIFQSYCKVHRREKDEESSYEDTVIYKCPECVASATHESSNERMLEKEAEEKKALIKKHLDSAGILPRFKKATLDNYKAETDEQKKAMTIINWFFDNISNSMGLIFLGNPGTGKNHLATGIVKKCIEEYGMSAKITETLKIIRQIKESWKIEGGRESKVLKSFLEPDILVIDELGVQFGSETERMYLTEIINDRYNFKLPTILIGNMNIEELKDVIGERPVDRFREGGKLLVFNWQSYRLRSI
jgi:DNA replication protein DnaC